MFSLIPLPVKILAITIGFAGAAFYGYTRGAAHAEVELANYRAKSEKQIANLTIENAKLSNNVVTEYVDRTNTIVEKQIIYRDSAAKMEPQHNMSNGWVHLHDVAAKLVDPNMQMAADSSPSGVMDNSALAVVMSNYSICRQNAEQLQALQKWIRETQVAVENSNKAVKEGRND